MAEPISSATTIGAALVTVLLLLIKEIFQYLRERAQARKEEKAAERAAKQQTTSDAAYADIKKMSIDTRSDIGEFKLLAQALKDTMDERHNDSLKFSRDRVTHLEDSVLARVFKSEARATRAAENSTNLAHDLYDELERIRADADKRDRGTEARRDGSDQDTA